MSEKTIISWCDSTVNPVHGCNKVSPGCDNCYITSTAPFRVSGMKHGDPRTFHPNALKLAERLNRKPWICDKCGSAEIRTVQNWNQTDDLGNPATAKFCVCGSMNVHRRRIFWESLGDFLDPKWNLEWLAQMLDTIRRCDQCVHILVSKRWENFHHQMERSTEHAWNVLKNQELQSWLWRWYDAAVPPRNIIGLCSVENQEMADKRIPQFLTVPLACRGLSLEPLLGPVDVSLAAFGVGHKRPSPEIQAAQISNPLSGLDWSIAGGESGPKARPCNVDWIRSIVEQGKAASVPTFVKQLGAKSVTEQHGGKFDGNQYTTVFGDKKGGDPAEWPADLRVQQWPKGF